MMAGNNTLDVFLGKNIIAQLSLTDDQLTWHYTTAWQTHGFAISPHLPLKKSIPTLNVQRFLRNVLPEGHALDELISCFNISKNNTFALIKALGFDIPGAIVLLPTGKTYPTQATFKVLPIAELTQRLNNQEHSSLIMWNGKTRLSVAGIQDKINIVINEEGDMGFGEGVMCSTHILKFVNPKLIHLVLNEYITMRLASACDLNVADVTLTHFDKHAALLVKRFDRQLVATKQVERKHMIDGCQALNLPPEYKYERNFGSNRDVAHIRDGVSLPKLFEFANQCINPARTKKMMLDWVLFNILIFNYDAHGKNISFFVLRHGIELTPFYDLVNIKMYPALDHEMAMALGDEFDSDTVNAYQLADFADSCQLPRALVAKQLHTLIVKLQSALPTDFTHIVRNQSEESYIDQYKKIVGERCKHLLHELDTITTIKL